MSLARPRLHRTRAGLDPLAASATNTGPRQCTMFTARANRNAMVSSATADCMAIIAFARRPHRTRLAPAGSAARPEEVRASPQP